jgi:glycosyltransferase involved in cell wall biosynthesis
VAKILLLSYYWPPAGGPGVQRWLKNAIHLQKLGWEVTVITPQNPVAANYDESLVAEVPKAMRVIKTNAADPFKAYGRLTGKKGKIGTGGIGISNTKSTKQQVLNFIRANFFIPDARKGWNKYALTAAREVLKEEKFAAVITTGPPHSTHLMGLDLQKEFSIKWLADFRDPWVNIFYNKIFPRTKRTKAKDQGLENLVLASADAILTVSPGLEAEFSARTKRIEIIYNGYDPADIPSPERGTQPFFSLRYTGNLKPNQNIEFLWTALADLCREEHDFKTNFRLEFIGNVDPSAQLRLEKLGLEEQCVYHGYQAHHVATKAMVEAGALLFIVPNTEDNHLILTGKLFEYLGSGTPMLSIGPKDGNAAKIIAETGRGKSIDYKDYQEIKVRVKELYRAWKLGKRSSRLSLESTAAYTRHGAAEKLSSLVEEICRD